MKEYELTAKLTISVYTKVQANSLDEAIQEAEERRVTDIIVDCASSETEIWMCDELDGVPYEIIES